MAVLEAVRGWEYFAGLPHINDVKKDEPATEEELGSDDVKEEGELEEDILSAEELEKELPDVLNSDYESLLIEHDEHVGTPSDESPRRSPQSVPVFQVVELLPSAQRERVRP